MTRALEQVKVVYDIERHESLQLDNVRGRAAVACYLFYHFSEGIPAHLHSAVLPVLVYVCVHTVIYTFQCVGSFTFAPGTSFTTESQCKLCCGTASELLKQSSADKPCILLPRERAKA